VPAPRILAIGAHPDDCDMRAGGTAILWARAGFAAQFVSVTNGEAGHHEMFGPALAARRKAEAQAAARAAGIEYVVLDNRDGLLLPSLEARLELIGVIRRFRPDLILTHRPNDYHPDHRYTSQLVQDCCYMVIVPGVCPEAPRLKRNPAAMYFYDAFQKPAPFRPDIAVDIGPALERKVEMLCCHASQVFEWLPWLEGRLDQVPPDEAGRKRFVQERIRKRVPQGEALRAALERCYGPLRAAAIEFAECFEVCEYGAPLDEAARACLFPWFFAP